MPARVSPASASADASSQPRTGAPRSMAITTPRPSARSRTPNARDSSFEAGRVASLPTHSRPARLGASRNAAPTAMRPRAWASAISRGSTPRRLSAGDLLDQSGLLEPELAVAGVHQHTVPRAELALEQLQRQLVDELLLNHALE